MRHDRFSIQRLGRYRSGSLTRSGRKGRCTGGGPVFNTQFGQPTFNDVEGTHGSLKFRCRGLVKVNEHFTITLEGIN